MTPKEVRSILAKYSNHPKLVSLTGFRNQEPSYWEHHILWMMEEMERMLDDYEYISTRQSLDRTTPARMNKVWDKIMRWLGFLQGVLWMNRVYTIDELKSDNRGVKEGEVDVLTSIPRLDSSPSA
jgi:hypothetical protein